MKSQHKPRGFPSIDKTQKHNCHATAGFNGSLGFERRKKEEDSFVSGLRVLEKYFVFRITVPMETHKPGREDTAINYILLFFIFELFVRLHTAFE